MHSGMRGGPHVGAFRQCSFTKTESYSKRNSRASSVIHLLVSDQQVLMVIHFPSVLQLLPECFRTPDTNLIPSPIPRTGEIFFGRIVEFSRIYAPQSDRIMGVVAGLHGCMVHRLKR